MLLSCLHRGRAWVRRGFAQPVCSFPVIRPLVSASVSTTLQFLLTKTASGRTPDPLACRPSTSSCTILHDHFLHDHKSVRTMASVTQCKDPLGAQKKPCRELWVGCYTLLEPGTSTSRPRGTTARTGVVFWACGLINHSDPVFVSSNRASPGIRGRDVNT